MPRQVFISHASANADVAAAICNGLESRGISCWMAPRDVAFDGTYGSEIVRGVRECDVFLIVVTESAAESQQVERETERASHYKKRIIPVIVGGADPGPRLEYYVAGRQQFPCPPVPDERLLGHLAAAIRPDLKPETIPLPAAPPLTPQPRRAMPLALIALAAVAILVVSVVAFVLNGRSDPETTTAVERSGTATPAGAASPSPPNTPSADDAAGRTGGPPSSPAVQPANTPTRGVAGGAPANGEQPEAGGPPPGPTTSSGKGPAVAGLTLVRDGIRVRFVPVPAGSFRMGCSDGDTACGEDEKPARRVVVDAFQMSATEVTQEFWQAVMGSNPSDFTGPRLPVEHVSWQDAQGFVDVLNEADDGFRYRLPTEAEWEYAARAGGASPSDLTTVAWFGLAQSSSRPSRPQAAGTKAPNAWGLHDIFGNVAEWCEDWYSPNYQRVVRGGAWDDGPTALRVSARGKAVPSTRVYSIGVRLVREPR